MRSALRQIGAWFAPREDPYAGGDMDNAARIGGLLWAMGAALIVLLLPISPPTDAIGDLGWLIAIAIVLSELSFIYALRRSWIQSWDALFLAACLSLAGMTLLQWLAGGTFAPYERLYLLPVLFVATLNPPRRITAFMLLVLLALFSPYIYQGWNSEAAGSSFASYVVWWVIAITGSLLMSGVRAQRLNLAREGSEAREEARRDSLTGLKNRRAFDETAAEEVGRAHRVRAPLSLVLLDIERFKQVNDRYGHLEGDRCLREVAGTIGDELREPDLCFRWGGDEFALLLAGTDATGAEHLAARVRESVRRACQRPDGEPVVLRVGVAELSDDSAPSELVAMADLALSGATREIPAEDPTTG